MTTQSMVPLSDEELVIPDSFRLSGATSDKPMTLEMLDGYEDVVTFSLPKQWREGGTVLLQFQTRSEETLRLWMKADVARYLRTQLHLLLLPAVQMDHLVNKPYQDAVTNFTPKESPDGREVLFKFQVSNDKVMRLKMSADIALHLGMQLLLLSAGPSTQSRFVTS